MRPVVEKSTERNATTGTVNSLTDDKSACGGVNQITDQRDVNNPIYPTVSIGTQCWLGRNLNVGTKIVSGKNQSNNKIIEKYCNSNDEIKCTTGGGLYQWNEAMQYTKENGAQGICPNGWHIPSDNDWATLEKYLADAGQNCEKDRVIWDCATAGDKLKQGGSAGFNVIFTGYRALYGKFDNDPAAYFWSSTQSVPESDWDVANPGAWLRHFYVENSTIQRDHFWQTIGISVRCIKDKK